VHHASARPNASERLKRAPTDHPIEIEHQGCASRMRIEDARRAKGALRPIEGLTAMIKSAADFERWIADKLRADVVAVTTARAALRALPLLNEDKPGADARADPHGPADELAGHARQYRKDVVLPVFRAMATAWTLAQYPDQLPDLSGFVERATDAVKSAYAGGIARYRSDGSYGTGLPVLLIGCYAAAIPFTRSGPYRRRACDDRLPAVAGGADAGATVRCHAGGAGMRRWRADCPAAVAR
jgi:hypothetical protein